MKPLLSNSDFMNMKFHFFLWLDIILLHIENAVAIKCPTLEALKIFIKKSILLLVSLRNINIFNENVRR